MNIVCKASNLGCDVRCAVCGQSFLVYWTSSSAAQRSRQHAEVLETLRGHHAACADAPHAHPAGEFSLPCSDAVKAALTAPLHAGLPLAA